MFTQEQRDNVNALVRELVSGEYKQGACVLKRVREAGPEYCCLGVAAEGVLGYAFYNIHKRQSDIPLAYGSGFQHKLSPEDAAKFGFDVEVTSGEKIALNQLVRKTWHASIGDLTPTTDRMSVLMVLNDNGVSFDKIAGVILVLGWNNY